ncbi:MAG TPA: hypothetical protein VF017_09960 [Thermoanaerobaculia bacterium]|nr:hypothetical protein [Thermoanaerobaculia bacterium]
MTNRAMLLSFRMRLERLLASSLFSGYSLDLYSRPPKLVLLVPRQSADQAEKVSSKIRALATDFSWPSDFEIEVDLVDDLHLFQRELRPSAGVLRFENGLPGGPTGTLSCLLSRGDGTTLYLLTAAHTATNFWWSTPNPILQGQGASRPQKKPIHLPPPFKDDGAIYQDVKGHPSPGVSRLVGRLHDAIVRPRCAPCTVERASRLDAAIVRITEEFDWRQRTTCFGSFGPLSDLSCCEPKPGTAVQKCGVREPHSTFGYVERKLCLVKLLGAEGEPYWFRCQFKIRPVKDAKGEGPAFAGPGDSGAMVVDRETREPLGMVIGGSVLGGFAVMTPIWTLRKFWERRGLVFLRG